MQTEIVLRLSLPFDADIAQEWVHRQVRALVERAGGAITSSLVDYTEVPPMPKPICRCGKPWPCISASQELAGHNQITLDDRPVLDDRDEERATGHLRNALQVLDLFYQPIAQQPTTAYIPEDGGAGLSGAFAAILRRVALARVAFMSWDTEPGSGRSLGVEQALNAAETEAKIAWGAWRRYLRQCDWQPVVKRVTSMLDSLRSKLVRALNECEDAE